MLSSSSLRIDPGGQVELTATVHNEGTVVDQLTINVLGAAVGWATVEPPTVNLLPGETAEVRVRFSPPDGPAAPIGQIPFAVRVRSVTGLTPSYVDEGVLEVGGTSQLTADLRPRHSRGRVGHHRLLVHNTGNVTLRPRVAVADPDELLRLELGSVPYELAPGAAAEVPLTARPVARNRPRVRERAAFTVTVGTETEVSVSLDGSFERERIIPRWAIATTAAAVLMVLAAVAFLGLTGNESGSQSGASLVARADPSLPAAPGQPAVIAPKDGAAVANPAGSAAPEIALDAPEHVAAAPLGQAPNGPLNVASARPGTPVTGGRSAAPSPAAKTAPRLYAGIALGARNVASGVSVVSLHRGHLDAFYRGTDNGLWHQWVDTWTGGWVAPERLGSFTFTATPAAVSWADGRIDVMLRGTDGHLYQVVWDGTWHLEAYELTPGGQHADLAGSPAITSRHSGHLDVYWRNSSHHLMHYWIDNRYSPDWQGPEALGGSTQMSSDPAVESSNDYRTDVFARSSRNGLMHMHWGDGGGWTAWSLVPGVSNVAWTPTAVYQRGSSFPRNVLVAYLGTDGQLWRVESRDSSSWARAVPLSGASVAAPGAASWANGRVDVLFRDAQGLLRQKFYDGTWHL